MYCFMQYKVDIMPAIYYFMPYKDVTRSQSESKN